MPRIARGGVGGAAHRRSGPSAFELAFLNTWLLFPCPISDLAKRLGLTFVISGDFGETKLKLTQIPLPLASPTPFLPQLFFPLSDLLPWPPFRKEADHQPPFVISFLGRDDLTS